MKTVFVLFDSLNRSAIGAYGSTEVATPNFDRLAARGVTFDTHYVGSLPCMPARRDLHTGRLNFMHRSWGPLEPFDNSFPALLREAGVYTHLITDHAHYFEDGGSTYHNRYTSWEFMRGQENDPWKAMVEPPLKRLREKYADSHYPLGAASEPRPEAGKRLQHVVNREFMRDERDYPGPRCFEAGFEFLDHNRDADNWFLQIECFDPHEPFDAPERFKSAYATGYNGGILNWPYYEKVSDSPEEIAEIRANYAALVAMCDHYFGRLLDYFDEHGLWRDTVLVLSTDHGFLLSEHDWWGKNLQPYYREISNIPLIIYHPDFPSQGGGRRRALTQTFDLMPTFIDAFGIVRPDEVQGRSLLPLLGEDRSGRSVGIFGMFGGPIGATDGRFTLYLYPEDLYAPGLNEYTLMPMHLNSLFSEMEMRTAELRGPFDFTKTMPVLKIDAQSDARRIPIHDGLRFADTGTRLFDLESDPMQDNPIRDAAIERRLMQGIVTTLRAHDAPPELYSRYGLIETVAEDRPA